jgi:hypothetical protein
LQDSLSGHLYTALVDLNLNVAYLGTEYGSQELR